MRSGWRQRGMPLAALLAALLVLTASACGGRDRTTVTVFAAASLTEAFTDLAAAFEAQHEDLTIALNFAGSSTLRAQIESGARADLFASADLRQQAPLAEAGWLRGETVVFARSAMVIVTPADNPAQLTSAADLARPGITLVLAGEEVPAGRYAREALRALAATYGADYPPAVLGNLVSNETNVRAVLTKVELGEADAGVVYRTDAAISGDAVHVILFPEGAAPLAEYTISRLRDGPQPEGADAFLAFLQSAPGAAILDRHGFTPA